MHSYRIVWEDEAKAREVELFVHYRLDAGVVSVDEVRPLMEKIAGAKKRFVVMKVLRGIHTRFLEFEPKWTR